MRFALQNEQVATTLVGMSKVRHVDRNLTAIGQPPDPDLLAEVQAIFAPVLNVVWEEGLPENFAPNAEPKQS
jgi:aryl-alcohol dehydrogenase-like predicted oxidoreductase